MASPQLENGFIRIANEIWQELRKMRIPGEAMQILMVIVEETYGWNRKEAMIQNKTFAEKTGIIKQHINRGVEKLKELNLILVTQKGYDIAPTYCFNKDHETWKVVTKKGYSNQKRLQVLPKKVTTTPSQPFSDNGSEVPKDSIKDNISTYMIFFENFWEIYPKRNGVKQGKKECRDFIVGKKKICPDDFDRVLTAIKNYSQKVGKYPKDPIRFLRHEIWRDYIESSKINTNEIFI